MYRKYTNIISSFLPYRKSLFDNNRQLAEEKGQEPVSELIGEDLGFLTAENRNILSCLSSGKKDISMLVKYYANLCKINGIEPVNGLIQPTSPSGETEDSCVKVYCRGNLVYIQRVVTNCMLSRYSDKPRTLHHN